MATRTNDFSLLFRNIISQWCAVPVPPTMAAAEQVLRTQLHPSLFGSLYALNTALRPLPLDARMDVIDRVGIDTLSEMYRRWYPDALPTLEAYDACTGDARILTQAVCDLAVLSAGVAEIWLHALYAAVVGVQTERALARQFGAGETMPEEVMVRQWTECQRHAHASRHAGTPAAVQWVNPIHVPVDTPSGEQWVSIPVQVRVHDPIEQHHDVVIHEPVPLTRSDVDRVVSVPYPSEHGMSVMFRLRDQLGFWHAQHRRHFFPWTLRRLFERSGGTPLIIGRQGHIRLHPAHFHSDTRSADMPHDPVAAVRRRAAYVDIQRLHPDIQLTVLG